MIAADVTVIIVNYNSGMLVYEAIQSLYRQTLKPKNIIVVDNASIDGSIENLRSLPQLTLMPQSKNLGFALANNLAAQCASTKWIAFLNPDAVADESWLELLLEATVRHPVVKVFTSKQLQFDNPHLLDGLGDYYHVSGRVGRVGYGAVDFKSLKEAPVFSGCGCALLVERKIFLEIGGFDSDFFCYIEDVDFGFRLQLLGYITLLVPNAIVWHHGSAVTGGRRSDFSIYYGHRNLVWAYFKNMPGFLFWFFLPLHFLLNLYSILYFIALGRGKIILRSKLDAIKGLPVIWQKRRQIQSSRVISAFDVFKLLEKSLIPFQKVKSGT